MPKKYVVFFKTIGRSWFLFLVVAIIIVAFYFPIIAIWMTVITLVLFLMSYIPPFFFKNKLYKFMKKYPKIDDINISKRLEKSLEKIQDQMYKLSQNQEKKKWLIVFLDKHYIFYNQEIIQKFKENYNKGLSEKEILDNLKDYKIETRSEIKNITTALIKVNRLNEREISVKEHRDKQRFM